MVIKKFHDFTVTETIFEKKGPPKQNTPTETDTETPPPVDTFTPTSTYTVTETFTPGGTSKDYCLTVDYSAVPALVNSGLPNDKFVFEGFLPVKKGRQTRLTFLAEETRTMIFYESPHKLVKTLTNFVEYFGEDRPISVSRELTKLYEETVRGTIAEVIQHFITKPPKGEFVVVVGGKK